MAGRRKFYRETEYVRRGTSIREPTKNITLLYFFVAGTDGLFGQLAWRGQLGFRQVWASKAIADRLDHPQVNEPTDKKRDCDLAQAFESPSQDCVEPIEGAHGRTRQSI